MSRRPPAELILMAIFMDCAPTLYSAGMAVLPLAPGDCAEAGKRAGKKPLVSSYNKWKHRPPLKHVEKWCKKFPDANVGHVPGCYQGRRIVVLDNDGGAREQIQDTFGKTPGIVDTRRGDHHFYVEPRGYSGQKIDLRALGINADWKSGNDIVVAPGSVHKSGFVYAWHECDERVLRELPEIDLRAVLKQIEAKKSDPKVQAGLFCGSRKLTLNKYLCKNLASVADHDNSSKLIYIAREWNEALLEKHIAKLDDDEVMRIAHDVWEDFRAEKLQPWQGGPAVVRSDADEINDLLKRGKFGSQAFAMLMMLRAAHGARCSRGETFTITPKAMHAHGTLPGFSREMIEACRNMLLQAGFLIPVAARQGGNQRKAAQFSLRAFRN
jgi:hypothetical protein